ncbi:hypothetical protein DRN62_02220 [Nanoarchaeota archaeon]|nr:MAG: hypothetical protein DRN62_02220 [Nanoarchaeota archaeon]
MRKWWIGVVLALPEEGLRDRLELALDMLENGSYDLLIMSGPHKEEIWEEVRKREKLPREKIMWEGSSENLKECVENSIAVVYGLKEKVKRVDYVLNLKGMGRLEERIKKEAEKTGYAKLVRRLHVTGVKFKKKS